MPEMQAADDFGGFENVAEGQYHAIIEKSVHLPDKKTGGQFNGMKISVQILAGTNKSEVAKVHNEWMAYPREGQKDGGTFCKERITNLLVAAGIIKDSQRSGNVSYRPGMEVLKPGFEYGDTDPEHYYDDFAGKQVIVFIKKKTDASGADNGVEIGHYWYPITSDRAKHVPKDAKAIRLAGYELDADGKTVKPRTAAKPAANGSKPTATPAPQPVAAVGENGDFLSALD